MFFPPTKLLIHSQMDDNHGSYHRACPLKRRWFSHVLSFSIKHHIGFNWPTPKKATGKSICRWITVGYISKTHLGIPRKFGSKSISGWLSPAALWKIWVRQLGWWHSQFWKNNIMSCSRKTTNQWYLFVWKWIPTYTQIPFLSHFRAIMATSHQCWPGARPSLCLNKRMACTWRTVVWMMYSDDVCVRVHVSVCARIIMCMCVYIYMYILLYIYTMFVHPCLHM